MLSGHKPSKTWFAGYPIRRIDHIFVTSEFSVNSIQVSHTALDRLASDHLPIIAELSLEQGLPLVSNSTSEFNYVRSNYTT
jgi:endonuclease/exonuclease/phosphatase family metal-dependent hydrolase